MFCKANSHTTLQHASAADCCDCCDRHGGADAFFLINQSPVSSDTSARARKIAMEEVVRQIGWKKIDCSSDGPLIRISYTHTHTIKECQVRFPEMCVTWSRCVVTIGNCTCICLLFVRFCNFDAPRTKEKQQPVYVGSFQGKLRSSPSQLWVCRRSHLSS